MATTVNRGKKKSETKELKPAKVGKKIVFVETNKEELKKPLVDISDLEFFSGTWSCACDRKSDISITDVKDGIHFIFRNKVYEKFASEHVDFAIWKDKNVYKRIYIRNNKTGLKIVKSAKNTRFVAINKSIKWTKLLKQYFVGDYKLKFDDDNELYYIER